MSVQTNNFISTSIYEPVDILISAYYYISVFNGYVALTVYVENNMSRTCVKERFKERTDNKRMLTLRKRSLPFVEHIMTKIGLTESSIH